jgi:hypothetical protein
MNQYFLMHKDEVCGSLIIDEDTGALTNYKDYHTGHSPFLGGGDVKRIKRWWEGRAVPASRKMIQEVLKESGCFTTKEYLAKNLALSMTDSYWICPVDVQLKYDDVKLTGLSSYNEGKIPYHNHTSYDPNASLGGQMEKYWDIKEVPPVLIKESYKYFGQQAINEGFATLVHERLETGIPYTSYDVGRTEDGGSYCSCPAFTSEEVEFVPAYEVIEGSKLRNDMSMYENYIRICASLGIEEDAIRDFMDYQTLTDFMISNTDEHLLNFGILRDPDTMRYIGPAPIFDSGNSMFYTDSLRLYTRTELLERKITSFYDSEEKMLKNVRNKAMIDPCLAPSKDGVIEYYTGHGFPEERAVMIAANYETKIEMTREFCRGGKMSLYHEKNKKIDVNIT